MKMNKETKLKREELKHTSDIYRKALSEDIDYFAKNLKTILTAAAAIGISFSGAYLLVKKLIGKKNETKVGVNHETEKVEVKNTASASFFTVLKYAIIKEVALTLLGIIKDRLHGYIEQKNAEKEYSDDYTRE